MLEASPFWVVAVTKSQRERWAAENVQRQGFDYYLPQTLSEPQPQRAQKPECLFPRYLFVRTNGRWRCLLGTFGVIGLVMQGEAPATMTEETLERLKAREDANGFIRLPSDPQQKFRAGDAVRISSGSFSGCKGIYQRTDSKERARILLDYLGRRTPILIGEELLEAAE